VMLEVIEMLGDGSIGIIVNQIAAAIHTAGSLALMARA
jgi:hypothetical protein